MYVMAQFLDLVSSTLVASADITCVQYEAGEWYGHNVIVSVVLDNDVLFSSIYTMSSKILVLVLLYVNI